MFPNASWKLSSLISVSYVPPFCERVDERLPLEHENAYVRASTAVAIAEAVEQLPNTASKVIEGLQAFYREKAKILAPEFDQYVS